MQRSTERILTTHAGSLPRPDDLVRMMWDKLDEKPVDAAKLAARVKDAFLKSSPSRSMPALTSSATAK
jgi:5-methyltetrahydropteroyltriglutamate--homocysteine methyltransferase